MVSEVMIYGLLAPRQISMLEKCYLPQGSREHSRDEKAKEGTWDRI